MKVIEIPQYYLPHLGGTELYAHRLARDLRQDGVDCEVVSSSLSRDGAAGEATVGTVPVTYLRSRKLLPRNPYLFGLRRLLEAKRPDVVHLHSLWYLCSAEACAAQRALGFGIVSSMHGIVPDRPSPVVRGFFRAWRPLAQWIADRSDRIVVLNQVERDRLHSVVRVGESKVRVVEAGVDASTPDPEVSARLRRELSPYLLFSGRIQPDKNPELALDGFAGVAASHPRLRLLFLGVVEPGQRAALEKRAGGLRERVLFLPPLDPVAEAAALASHYAEAEASLCLGTWEGQPTRLIESMAQGVPAVAWASGGVPDLVRDGESGWLLPALEAGALAAVLRRALECRPAERAGLSQGARAAVRGCLWPDKYRRLKAVLEEAAELARARRAARGL